MVNRVILVGNLGNDPEVKYTTGGQAVCSLRLATSYRWKDKNAGEMKEETTWHDVECWGKTAELCGEHLTKGRQVYVEGRLKRDTWEKDGQRRERVKVVAENVRFLGGKGGGQRSEQEQDREQRGAPPDDGFASGGGGTGPDDIPFAPFPSF